MEEEDQLSPSCPEGLGKKVRGHPSSPGRTEAFCVEEAESFGVGK